MKVDSDLHKLLQRQLKHLNLSMAVTPTNLQQWQDFIARVDKAYVDADEARYLVERSIEIATRETKDLNEKLENAQNIAGVGSWNYDSTNGNLVLSRNFASFFNIGPKDPMPPYEYFLSMIHPEDIENFNKLSQQVMDTGIKQKLEMRVKSSDNEFYNWYSVRINPYHSTTLPCHQIICVAVDITKRKQSAEEIESLHQEILQSARQVGMADVATSILHNVGNILNSVNVSVNILKENIDNVHFKRFAEVCSLLNQNSANIHNYILNDPKGKLIPEYLLKLSEVMRNMYELEHNEVISLMKKVEHINDIISSQQSLAEVNSVKETFLIADAMESALKMAGSQFTEQGIEVTKNFENTGYTNINRSKLLQILVNLIQNAKDAIIYENSGSNKSKLIELSIKNATEGRPYFEIAVKDNGIGIAGENMDKIFSYGYSTKKKGHGIGLHSSMLAAKEIGAKLEVYSAGVGQGATFTLTIPISATI